MVLKDPVVCLWNITCVLVFMLVVGCYELFELHVGSANKHLPEYIFLGMGNILCNNWARLIYFQLLDIWETRKKFKSWNLSVDMHYVSSIIFFLSIISFYTIDDSLFTSALNFLHINPSKKKKNVAIHLRPNGSYT